MLPYQTTLIVPTNEKQTTNQTPVVRLCFTFKRRYKYICNLCLRFISLFYRTCSKYLYNTRLGCELLSRPDIQSCYFVCGTDLWWVSCTDYIHHYQFRTGDIKDRVVLSQVIKMIVQCPRVCHHLGPATDHSPLRNNLAAGRRAQVSSFFKQIKDSLSESFRHVLYP